MFIPKKNRIAVYSYLFKEGVCVVKKDSAQPTHPEIEGVSNLEVMMLMKSLASRGLVRVTFSWQHNYCYLTTESEDESLTGLDYLRTYLALPAEIVPATMKKAAARPGARPEEEGGKQFGGDKPSFRGGDREYRGQREGGGRDGGFGRGGGGF
jgi:small subunit ribosomal protein S10e